MIYPDLNQSDNDKEDLPDGCSPTLGKHVGGIKAILRLGNQHTRLATLKEIIVCFFFY